MSGPARGPHGLMFHHFEGQGHAPGQGAITADDFEWVIEDAGPGRILGPDAWLSKLRADALEPGHLCLTFDDGLLAQYEVAKPIMDRFGLRAFWFVYSSVFEGGVGRFEVYRKFRHCAFSSLEEFYAAFFAAAEIVGVAVDAAISADAVESIRKDYPFYSVDDVRYRLLRDRVLGPERFDGVMESLMTERGVGLKALSEGLWMTADHLRALTAEGHHVGLHTYSHPMALASLPVEVQRDEYERNYAHLTAVCGTEPAAVAHPVNSYGADTLEVLRDLGIECGFRANMAPSPFGGRMNASPLEFAREDHANVIGRRRASCGRRSPTTQL